MIFQVESTLIAMSSNGLEMPDLQISPAKAQVKASLVRQMITVEVPVVVETTGALTGRNDHENVQSVNLQQ